MNGDEIRFADNDVRYIPGIDKPGEHSAVAHESRYGWVARAFELGNARILDFGCGSGYGAHLIAQHAGAVDAVDYSTGAIEYASARFACPNLNFFTSDASSEYVLGLLGTRRYDFVLSFDVIEHIERYFDYLDNVSELLKRDGIAIIGCPNRLQCFEWNRQWNPYHFQEFSPYQLRKILSQYFESVVLFAQDFHDTHKREIARLQNRGERSVLKTALRESLPGPAVQAVKTMKRLMNGSRTNSRLRSSDISFLQEPGEEVLQAAFGLVAVCSSQKRSSGR